MEKKPKIGFITMVKAVFKDFGLDKCSQWGAAIAFYTVFSLAPMLVVAIYFIGMVYGEEAATGQIVGQLENALGRQAAETIQQMIQGASEKSSSGLLGSILSLGLLIFGASKVFVSLQDALNVIFNVRVKPKAGFKVTIKKRMMAFGMVFGVAFCLIAALVVNIVIEVLLEKAGHLLPIPGGVAMVLATLVPVVFLILLFGLLYNFIPDARIPWKDALVGAVVAALLFGVGKYILSWYLGRQSYDSVYGAAGSFVLLLWWMYYTALIFLLGAETVKVYGQIHGEKFEPESHAVKVHMEPPGVADTDLAPQDRPAETSPLTKKERQAAKAAERHRQLEERRAERARRYSQST